VATAQAEGKEWMEQRKFILQHLGNLGMGKRDTMEEVIGQEAQALAESIRVGQPVPVKVKP